MAELTPEKLRMYARSLRGRAVGNFNRRNLDDSADAMDSFATAWAADRKEKAYLAEALTNVNNRLSMAQIEALEKVPVITMGDACPACGACDYICRDCGAAALRGEEER